MWVLSKEGPRSPTCHKPPCMFLMGLFLYHVHVGSADGCHVVWGQQPEPHPPCSSLPGRAPPPHPAPPGHQEALSHFLCIETPGGQEGRDSFTKIKLREGRLSEMNELTKVKPGRAIPVTRSLPWCDPHGVQLPSLQGSAVGAGGDVQASFWRAVEAQT